MATLQLNKLEMPTFRWLKVNEATGLSPLKNSFQKAPETTLAQGATLENIPTLAVENLPEDLQNALTFLQSEGAAHTQLTLPAGFTSDTPIVLTYTLDGANSGLYQVLSIQAGKGAKATVVVNFTSADDTPHFAGHFTYIDAQQDTDMHYIEMQRLNKESECLAQLYATVHQKGKLETTFGEFGAKLAVKGALVSLDGAQSQGEMNCLYTGIATQEKDMKYNMRFVGEKSQGDIDFKGALAGSAKKILRSTIDFVRGAKEAVGKEEETVLVLGEAVRNVSVPLLLAGENDIVGEHATSTGKPDETKLFYLMSRGLPEQDAKKLMVEASFTPILNKLPQALKEEVKEIVNEVIYHESL